MASIVGSLRDLADDALLLRARALAADDRRVTADLIETIAEIDLRRLYLAQSCASTYEYCVDRLHLTEHAAYVRIQAARLSRRFPLVLERLESSEVSLTALTLLGPFFTESNCLQLLDEARGRKKSGIEEIVARLNPKPDVPSMVRRAAAPSKTVPALLSPDRDDAPGRDAAREVLPSAPPACSAPEETPAPTSRPTAAIKPLAPERFKVQFTISGETRAKLRVVQDLLRHSVPSGDLASVFDRALSALLADLEKRKLALVARPRQTTRPAKRGTRLIPAAVRRAVWARDKGRCAFAGPQGRCRERGGLELHHVRPFAAGGEATIANIELRCRAHNGHEADVFFGAGRGP